MKLLVFDTESTARDGQVCQLAYLMIDGGQITAHNQFFVVDSMADYAQAVHGLNVAELLRRSGGTRFADCAADILRDFAAADLWVGHNISADIRSLRIELDRLGLALSPRETLCTMNHFTPILKLKRLRGPGSPKPPRLSELCAHYGVTDALILDACRTWFGDGTAAHDARFDVAATYLALMHARCAGDIALDIDK